MFHIKNAVISICTKNSVQGCVTSNYGLYGMYVPRKHFQCFCNYLHISIYDIARTAFTTYQLMSHNGTKRTQQQYYRYNRRPNDYPIVIIISTDWPSFDLSDRAYSVITKNNIKYVQYNQNNQYQTDQFQAFNLDIILGNPTYKDLQNLYQQSQEP